MIAQHHLHRLTKQRRIIIRHARRRAEPVRAILDLSLSNATSVPRQRQARDEPWSCGNQPAYHSMINRRSVPPSTAHASSDKGQPGEKTGWNYASGTLENGHDSKKRPVLRYTGRPAAPALRCKEIVFHPIDHYYRASPATAPGGGCLREVCAPRHSRVRSRIGPTTIGTEDAKRIIPRRPEPGQWKGSGRNACGHGRPEGLESRICRRDGRIERHGRTVHSAKPGRPGRQKFSGTTNGQSGRRDRPVRHARCERSSERSTRSEIGRPNPRIPSWGSSNAQTPNRSAIQNVAAKHGGLRFSRCEVPGVIHWRSAIVVTGGNTVKSHDKGSGG